MRTSEVGHGQTARNSPHPHRAAVLAPPALWLGILAVAAAACQAPAPQSRTPAAPPGREAIAPEAGAPSAAVGSPSGPPGASPADPAVRPACDGSPTPHPEAAAMAAKYGPDRHSQYCEEWIARDYFADRRGGFFVDVGANDPERYSNTYYLETVLGWSGIAIDPVADFAPAYTERRPLTRFFPFFVSDVTDARATVFMPGKDTLVVSSTREFSERWGKDLTSWAAPTIRLSDLLDRTGVKRVDLLSIDVELAEPQVLAGFDIERFRPSFVCIEAHPEVRQRILDYFARHRYVIVGRYLRVDAQNLYFEPLAGRRAGR